MSKNFAKNLEEASDEELLNWINTLNPTFVELASDELTRRCLRRLDATVEVSNKKTEAFNARMLWLTVAISVLTLALVIREFLWF